MITDIDFDLYGYGWNINDSRYKGKLDSKSSGLINYEYSIAIENCCEKNYVTEKLFDCFLCDTIPIYYGCPNITGIYDSNSYHILDVNNSMEHILEIISSPKEKNAIIGKDKYFSDYNLLKYCYENL